MACLEADSMACRTRRERLTKCAKLEKALSFLGSELLHPAASADHELDERCPIGKRCVAEGCPRLVDGKEDAVVGVTELPPCSSKSGDIIEIVVVEGGFASRFPQGTP